MEYRQNLKFYRKLRSNKLSFVELTEKTLTLLALSTGHRIQTLASLDIRNIIVSEQNLNIKVPARLKTIRLGAIQPCLTLPYLYDKPQLCVASTLMLYLNHTKNLRGAETILFIATRNLYKKVSTQTIS